APVNEGAACDDDKTCCTVDSAMDAKRVCDQLGIPHYTLDMQDDFEERVIRPFYEAYLHGERPTRASTATASSSGTPCGSARAPSARTTSPPVITRRPSRPVRPLIMPRRPRPREGRPLPRPTRISSGPTP